MKFRVGRKVPRNIYVQLGDEPSDGDLDIGRFDDKRMARVIVRMLNESDFGRWHRQIQSATEEENFPCND